MSFRFWRPDSIRNSTVLPNIATPCGSIILIFGHWICAFPIADVLFAKGKPFGFVTSYSAVPQARTYHAQVLNKPIDSRDLRALVQSFTH